MPGAPIGPRRARIPTLRRQPLGRSPETSAPDASPRARARQSGAMGGPSLGRRARCLARPGRGYELRLPGLERHGALDFHASSDRLEAVLARPTRLWSISEPMPHARGQAGRNRIAGQTQQTNAPRARASDPLWILTSGCLDLTFGVESSRSDRNLASAGYVETVWRRLPRT